MAEDAAPALRELDAAGELVTCIPELNAGRGFLQPALHHFDVFQHNLSTVEALDRVLGATPYGREFRATLSWYDMNAVFERSFDGVSVRALLRLACLVHDVAKPHTATTVDGRLRFPRHGPRGADMMAARLPALGLAPDAVTFVTTLVRYHLRPAELVRSWPPTDRAVRRFVRDLGGEVLPLMLLQMADGMATRGPAYAPEHFRRHCQFLNYVVAHACEVMAPPEAALVTGEDVMRELGLASGRLLGAVLTSIRQAQHTRAISTRAEALDLARRTVAELSRTPAS